MADPIPSPPPPTQPPKVARRRKWRLILSIVVVVLVLAGIVVGAVLLLQRSVEIPPQFTGVEGEVPLSGESDIAFEEEGTSPSASDAPAAPPTFTPAPAAEGRVRQESLAVTVRYERAQTFDLAVAKIERTFAYPSKNTEPATGEPFSTIKILDAQGRVLVQQRFAIVTELHVEEFGERVEPEDVGLAESEDTYILGLPIGGAKPEAVVIESGSGLVLDQQTFTYDELPEQTSAPATSSNWWDWLRGIPTALAQGTSGATFKIVVTNELGAPIPALDRIFANTQAMATELDPWKTYSQRSQVEVVRLQNSTTDLGCKPIPTTSGRDLPGCPNAARVGNFVSNHGQGGDQHPDWDAIIVVVNVTCRTAKGCGASIFNTGVVGVGATGGVPELMAHELGHAVRGLAMQDEYLGDLEIEGPAKPPNCFASENECLEANAPFQGDGVSICSLHCNSVESWRPANQIMYAAERPYGGLECTLTDIAIANNIGAEATGACLGEDIPLPGEDRYWGWYRGGAV